MRQKLAHRAPGQTLNATVLVNEAYLRLVGESSPILKLLAVCDSIRSSERPSKGAGAFIPPRVPAAFVLARRLQPP